jgi:hypothetical protein
VSNVAPLLVWFIGLGNFRTVNFVSQWALHSAMYLRSMAGIHIVFFIGTASFRLVDTYVAALGSKKVKLSLCSS